MIVEFLKDTRQGFSPKYGEEAKVPQDKRKGLSREEEEILRFLCWSTSSALVESGSGIHTIQQIPKTVEKQVGSEATKLLRIVRIKDSWEELHKLQKIVTG